MPHFAAFHLGDFTVCQSTRLLDIQRAKKQRSSTVHEISILIGFV